MKLEGWLHPPLLQAEKQYPRGRIRVAIDVCHSPTGLLMGVGFKILLIKCQGWLGAVIILNPQSHMTGIG